MPLILPGNVGSATAATGYDVANSLRLDVASTAYLSVNMGTSSNRRIWTFSIWHKKSTFGGTQNIVGTGGSSDQNHIVYENSQLTVRHYNGSANDIRVGTNRQFEDVSAFYHIVVAVDTTQGTAANRVKIYVNGVQETSFEEATYPDQNYDWDFFQNGADTYISRRGHNDESHLDGYIAEVAWLDGTQAAPTAFGEFDSDSGIWKPKDFKSDVTFGDAGFYLEFKESGTSQNSSGLGADTSGQTNHFAVNNLTAIDQSTDTCTNNFATLNPLDNVVSQAVFTEGNLKSTMNNSNSQGVGSTGTFWVSSGKWYVEAKLINNAGDNGSAFGVTGKVGLSTASADRVGNSADAITYTDTGQKAIAGSYTNSYGSSFTNGDIIGIYIDLDNLKIYFAKNGSLQNSGTGLTLNAIANTLNGVYTFSVGMNAGTGTPVFEINFGGTQTYSISSAVTDDNGYGNFEYSPNITGDSVAKKFYSMCTKNLAEYG
tara:strand:- start:18 stop:1472 length:1455 start_codon:yes stop_codon:yes gene_type:complete